MTTVLTARQLRDAYMTGTGGTITIDRQQFDATYGRFAIYGAASAFQSIPQNQFGGSLSAMQAAQPNGGGFSFAINHLITDIHSEDYMNGRSVTAIRHIQ